MAALAPITVRARTAATASTADRVNLACARTRALEIHLSPRMAIATMVAPDPSMVRRACTAPTASTAARVNRGRRRHRVRPSAPTGCPSTWCLSSITLEVWRPSRRRGSSLRASSSFNSISARARRAWGSWSSTIRPPSCPPCPPIPTWCSRLWPTHSKPTAGLPSAAASRPGLPSSRRAVAGPHGRRCSFCSRTESRTRNMAAPPQPSLREQLSVAPASRSSASASGRRTQRRSRPSRPPPPRSTPSPRPTSVRFATAFAVSSARCSSRHARRRRHRRRL